MFQIPTRGSFPQDIRVAPDGTLWFVEGRGDRIGRIVLPAQLGRQPEVKFTEFSMPRGVFPQGAVFPQSLQFDSAGNFWVTLKTSNQIMRVDPETNEVRRFRIPTAGSQPIFLTADPDGRTLWFPESRADKLGRIDIDTGEIKEYNLPRRGSSPLDVAVDPRTELVYFAAVDGHYIGQLDPETGEIKEFLTPTPDSSPTSLTFDKQGDLWTSLIDANKIARLDLSTGEFEEFELKIPNGGPGMIRTASNGLLYFTALYGNYIGQFNPETGEIVEFEIPVSPPTPINLGPIDPNTPPTRSAGPASIAFAEDGSLWVTLMFADGIVNLTPE
jgi:virginiamycin B lyase